jgi:acyl carrier protein
MQPMTESWDPKSLSEHIHGLLRDELLYVDDQVDTRASLIEAGLDSLAVTQLMLSIQESTGVWVDEGLLTPENLESCESLAACVYGLLETQ